MDQDDESFIATLTMRNLVHLGYIIQNEYSDAFGTDY